MGHCTLSIPVAISKKYFIMLAIVLEEHSIHVQQRGWLTMTYSVEQAKSKIELQNEMSDFYIKASWILYQTHHDAQNPDFQSKTCTCFWAHWGLVLL